MMYPWLERPFKRLVERGRALPHGVLLTGPKGIGKLVLAREIARSLLCADPQKIGQAVMIAKAAIFSTPETIRITIC